MAALTPPAPCAGDTALLLHVIPATYPTLEPALGLGGEGVFTSVPDPEAEQLRVRLCSLCLHESWLTNRVALGTQREAAEKFIANKLVPLLKDVPGLSVRHAVLRFATDADSVGRVICTNAEELGATMVVLPTHGKGRLRELIMGSTANYCTHHSRVPVLVFR
jgi:nucleotide-binding universal stress UspA family protein